jgi:hypothetical protein
MTSSCSRILALRLSPHEQGGILAYFDVALFGEMNLRGCHLKRREDGRLYFVAPGGGREGARPRIHVYGARLRRDITRAAITAYEAQLAAQDRAAIT